MLNSLLQQARSPLKFPGGKSQQTAKILATFGEGEIYVEPFAGSAVVGINARHEYRVISDANPAIVNLLNAVKHHPDELLSECAYYWAHYQADGAYGDSKATYYAARKQLNEQLGCACQLTVADAALTAWMNRHCFNGLMRYNRKGLFNSPAGDYKNPTIPEDQIWEAHLALRGDVKIVVGDWREDFAQDFAQLATAGAHIYYDPPYINSFSGYWSTPFTINDHIELNLQARALADLGATCLVSSVETKEALDTYYLADVHLALDAQRSIAADANQRGYAQELLFVYRPPWWSAD